MEYWLDALRAYENMKAESEGIRLKYPKEEEKEKSGHLLRIRIWRRMIICLMMGWMSGKEKYHLLHFS